jgi:hypothetical protein
VTLLLAKIKVSTSLKRKGAVHKRRVTVDSAELPGMSAADRTASEADPEVEPGSELVEKRRVSTMKRFKEKLKTNSALNLMEKVRPGTDPEIVP